MHIIKTLCLSNNLFTDIILVMLMIGPLSQYRQVSFPIQILFFYIKIIFQLRNICVNKTHYDYKKTFRHVVIIIFK